MFTKTTVLSAALLALGARAQHDGPAEGLNPNPKDTSNPRLVGKLFPSNQIPYQADTSNGERGPQFGYNLCNSTTAGQDSKCQTFILNDIGDFCLPAPPKLGTVGDTEEQGVAWCTKKTHGARLIPEGALSAVQYIQTPSYVAITGYIKQELINIPANDDGGEYDSGGQDNRGNPVGALVYSNSLAATKGTLTQARMWHAFMGSGVFCIKACSDAAPNASGLCRHIYDTYGCEVNVPNSYQENVFLSCQGEDQDPVLPGHSRIPASSNCVTYTSSKLYTDLSAAQPSATPSSSGSSSGSASSSATQSSKPTSTPVGTAAGGGGVPNSSSSSKPVTPVSLPTTTSQSGASAQTSAPPDGALSRVPISGAAIVLGALGLAFGVVFA